MRQKPGICKRIGRRVLLILGATVLVLGLLEICLPLFVDETDAHAGRSQTRGLHPSDPELIY